MDKIIEITDEQQRLNRQVYDALAELISYIGNTGTKLTEDFNAVIPCRLEKDDDGDYGVRFSEVTLHSMTCVCLKTAAR